MSDANQSSQPAAQPSRPPQSNLSLRQGLVWLLYTNNPFYLLSACFVFHGVALWFRADGGPHEPSSLTTLVGGYILMMAAAGFGLVRFGRVWDDARSILLVIVVLFPVLALTLDDTMLNNLDVARWLSIGGFVFALAVSEVLLLGLRIRLSLLFRGPYYGMLALLFLYPLTLLPDATDGDPVRIAWRVFYFSPLAATVFLSLVPAIRRGAALVSGNGTPWSWPRFPWTLFITLGICVCFRAYSLSLSFDPVLSLGTVAAMNLQSAFGTYFFLPILFAIAVLLVEFGVESGNKQALRIAVLIPGLCLVLAIPNGGANAAYSNFLAQFTEQYGSPIFLAVWASCLFFAYGLLRKVRLAEAGLVMALLVLSVVGPQTLGVETLVEPKPLPLAFLGVLELTLAVVTLDSRRFTIGALAGVAVLHVAAFPYWLMTGHLAAGVVLVVGVLFRDDFAEQLRQVGALLLAAGCIGALYFPPPGNPPVWVIVVYVASLCLASMALAVGLRSLAFCCSTLAAVSAVGAKVAWNLILYFRDWPGIESFLLASQLLGVGVGVSTLKTTRGRRFLAELRETRLSATNDSG